MRTTFAASFDDSTQTTFFPASNTKGWRPSAPLSRLQTNEGEACALTGAMEGSFYLIENAPVGGFQFGLFGVGTLDFGAGRTKRSEQSTQLYGSLDANPVAQLKSASSFYVYQGNLMLTTSRNDRIEMMLSSWPVPSLSAIPFPTELPMRYRVTRGSDVGTFHDVRSAGHLKLTVILRPFGYRFNLSFLDS